MPWVVSAGQGRGLEGACVWLTQTQADFRDGGKVWYFPIIASQAIVEK